MLEGIHAHVRRGKRSVFEATLSEKIYAPLDPRRAPVELSRLADLPAAGHRRTGSGSCAPACPGGWP